MEMGTYTFLSRTEWPRKATHAAEHNRANYWGGDWSVPGVVLGTFGYDLMGRQISEVNINGWNGFVSYTRTATYNAKGQLVSDDVSVWRNDDVYRTLSTYSYGTGANYALGQVTQIDALNWKDGNTWPTNQTINTYAWRDGPVLDLTVFNGAWSTDYQHDIIGGQAQLARAGIADGRPRTVSYVNDFLGQAIRLAKRAFLEAAGVDHEIGLGLLLLERKLGGDFLARLLYRAAITLHQALYLNLWRAAHDHEEIESLPLAGLDEQGRFRHHRADTVLRHCGDAARLFLPDLWMHDLVEPLSGGRVLEHDRAQFLPIDLAVRSEDGLSKGRHHRFESLVPAAQDLMPHLVEVDDRNSPVLQTPRDRRLPRGDGAGQANAVRGFQTLAAPPG
mgnify:CR=1 FL=1